MTGFDIGTAQAIYLGNTLVDSIYLGSTKLWPTSSHDYSLDYLTFEAIESGTFSINSSELSYSLDDGTTWTTLAANTQTPTVAAGNKILWKAQPASVGSEGIGKFTATGNFNVMGNVMSLVYGDNFIGQTTLSLAHCLYGLFNSNTKVISAEHLIMPLAYESTDTCHHFFYGCSSLVTPPELPSTSLAWGCYANFFENCTSLTTAPELPATTLATYCYHSMFKGCSSLNYIKCLAKTNINSTNCGDWTNGVAVNGTFVKDANTTWSTGTSGIPSGWTVVDAN